MSFLFATSEVLSRTERLATPDRPKPNVLRNQALFLIHTLCALVILIAGACAFLGLNFGGLTRLYVGQAASVWAFGLSWLLAGFYLTASAGSRPPLATTQSSSRPRT